MPPSSGSSAHGVRQVASQAACQGCWKLAYGLSRIRLRRPHGAFCCPPSGAHRGIADTDATPPTSSLSALNMLKCRVPSPPPSTASPSQCRAVLGSISKHRPGRQPGHQPGVSCPHLPFHSLLRVSVALHLFSHSPDPRPECMCAAREWEFRRCPLLLLARPTVITEQAVSESVSSYSSLGLRRRDAHKLARSRNLLTS